MYLEIARRCIRSDKRSSPRMQGSIPPQVLDSIRTAVADSVVAAQQAPIGERVASWFVFNVIFALLPIAVNLLSRLHFKKRVSLYELLKDGELFIYASTLSAVAIGQESLARHEDGLAHTASVWALTAVLIMATVLFTLSGVNRLHGQEIPNQRMVKIGSLACGVSAVLFGVVLSFL